jgi:hypothetical protein
MNCRGLAWNYGDSALSTERSAASDRILEITVTVHLIIQNYGDTSPIAHPSLLIPGNRNSSCSVRSLGLRPGFCGWRRRPVTHSSVATNSLEPSARAAMLPNRAGGSNTSVFPGNDPLDRLLRFRKSSYSAADVR